MRYIHGFLLLLALLSALPARAGTDFNNPSSLTSLGLATSTTDNAVIRADGTTGGTQNSGVLIDDSNNLTPAASDGGGLGTSSLMWSDMFLASGGIINWNNGNMTLTHTAGALALSGGELNTALSSTADGAIATIDDAALLGQDVVTWTPGSDPSGTFVTNRMRKTIVDTSSSAITGVEHPIAGYDYLLMQGNNNLDLAFGHESKFKKTGSGTLANFSFYKPAIDTIDGTVTNLILYDGDMDLSGVTYSNAWLLKNASRSYLAIETVGKVMVTTTQQELIGNGYIGSENFIGPMGSTDMAALGAGGVAQAAGHMWCTKIKPTKTGVPDSVQVNVTADGGGDLRICTYTDATGSTDSRPTTLIEDMGVLSVTGTGIKTDTPAVSTPGGVYWICEVAQGNTLTVSFAVVNNPLEVYGGDSSRTAGEAAAVETGVTGACPSTFGGAMLASSYLTPDIRVSH